MHFLLSVPTAYRWAITLVFVGIVVALSITPGTGRPDDSIFSWLVANTTNPIQKAMHIALYATLAALWMWTLASIESRFARLVLALVATVSLGALLEWQQTRVPGRFGSVADVLLNTLGAVAGLIAAILLL